MVTQALPAQSKRKRKALEAKKCVKSASASASATEDPWDETFDTWETLKQEPTCGLGLEALLNGSQRHRSTKWWKVGTRNKYLSLSLSLSLSHISCGKTQKIPLIDRYVRFFIMLNFFFFFFEERYYVKLD